MQVNTSNIVVLGVTFGHDSSVTILVNGIIKSHILSERITGVKHNYGVSKKLIQEALNEAKICALDITHVAVSATQEMPMLIEDSDYIDFFESSKPGSSSSSQIIMCSCTAHSTTPDQKWVSDYRETVKSYLKSTRGVDIEALKGNWCVKLWNCPSHYVDEWQHPVKINDFKNYISACFDKEFNSDLTMTKNIVVKLDGREIEGIIVDHHLSHACSSYFTSNFESSLILTQDGGVGYNAGFIFLANGINIQPVCPHFMENGQFFDFTSVKVGMHAIGGAGKLMGLASYGSQDLSDTSDIGTIADWLDNAKTQDRTTAYSHMLEKWLEKFPDYNNRHPITDPDPNLNLYAKQIAYSAQNVITKTIKKIAADSCSILHTDVKNICLSGGVSLNCPSNTEIHAMGIFDSVHIEPHCDDGGLSIGAAAYLYSKVSGMRIASAQHKSSISAYMGADRSDLIRELLFSQDEFAVSKGGDIASQVAEEIAKGGVVAIFQPKSETGPRSLGSRSILADPRVQENWARVNKIKHREYWRPFAPVCLFEDMDIHFAKGPKSSPFMLFTHDIISNFLPAITHVDGTARVQTVIQEDGFLYDILKAFKSITGVGVLLNTSFNGPRQPIIEYPEEAVQFLRKSDISCLAFESIILKKIGQTLN